ncbi:MAG: aspartate kinase [Ginsengibacter sp.]
MKVFKFGGASINSIERIQQLPGIIARNADGQLIIIISAMGKITNALEKVVEAYCASRKEESLLLFEKVKKYHLTQIKYLITQEWEKATESLNNIFTETESILDTAPSQEYDYDYYYDQIVSTGELLSSTLISYFLAENNIDNRLADVRRIIQTNGHYRDAKVNWDITSKRADEIIGPLFTETNTIVTQGFIGGTSNNTTTTLGREGSDYTAAIFANILDAESVTIWKDVNGVMSGDPKDFKDAETISQLSYKEVIEMAYYGAQVIHPKTIKPLQNKLIPLLVKSFLDDDLGGTVITNTNGKDLPPVKVIKNNQALFTFQSLDYSFVEGKPVNYLHELLESLHIKPNLSQNTAISLLISMDDEDNKADQLAEEATFMFDVSIVRNLQLITIRHYTREEVDKLCGNKIILLEQKTQHTIQILVKEE